MKRLLAVCFLALFAGGCCLLDRESSDERWRFDRDETEHDAGGDVPADAESQD